MRLLKYNNKYYNAQHIYSFAKTERGLIFSFDDGNTITVNLSRQKFIDGVFNYVKESLQSNSLTDIDQALERISNI